MATLAANGIDNFLSDYRMYIEGVQVPFESAHISNVYGEFPTATISLPPFPGLSEIGRNYAPKVSLFWLDPNMSINNKDRYETPDTSLLREKSRDAYKLIYSGVIVGTNDSKEIHSEGGGQSLQFQCAHPIRVLNDILLRFANQAIPAEQNSLGQQSAEGGVQSANWDATTLMVRALMGVSETTDTEDLHYAGDNKFEELKGTPGILKVLWNILKSDSKRPMGSDNDAEAMVDLFIPMVENGLKFWDRMTGHPSIEEGIASETYAYESPEVNRGNSKISGDVMVPGSFRTFIGEAAQKELSVAVMNSLGAGFSTPEAIPFYTVIMEVMRRLEYELTTLSSPISKPDGSLREYIVKPKLPYYYSPICNVILPNLLQSISTSTSFGGMPTRTVNLNNWTALVSGGVSGGYPSQQYTSPHSVRYARAGGDGGDLRGSLNPFNNKVGRYEWGTGVKSSTSHMPPMYNVLQANLDKQENQEDIIDDKVIGENSKIKAEEAWNVMYPQTKWPGAPKYNPLSEQSGITAFQRLNFLYADHDFAAEISKARTAQASGCFNPYPVIGYPMDIVDPVPSRDSYHGLCTSISHSIHAGGTSTTSYGLSAVTTLSELALYNLPSVNPYLTSALDFDEDFRIYRNATAYRKACQVYLEVLGVGAAEPAILQDYDTGTQIPVTRLADSGCWQVGNDSRVQDSQRGSLLLVARNISSLTEIEKDSGNNHIDISDWIDRDYTGVVVKNSPLRVEIESEDTKISTPGLDAESSPFLDYEG